MRTQRLVHQLRDRATREDAERHLIEMGSAAVPEVMELLEDASADTRLAAIRVLTASADMRVLPLLLSIMLDPTETPSIRAWLAQHIHNFRDERVTQALLSLVPDAALGAHVLAALRHSADHAPRAGELLKARLAANDPSAIPLMQAIASTYVLDVFITRLDEPTQRLEAMQVLRAAAPHTRDMEVVRAAADKLLPLLDHAVDLETRYAALETMVALRLPVDSKKRLTEQCLALLAASPADYQAALMDVLATMETVPRPLLRKVRDRLSFYLEGPLHEPSVAALVAIGFDPTLADEVCFRCERTQDEITLYGCVQCGRVVCKTHVVEEGPFCSKLCRQNAERGVPPEFS